MFVGHGLNRNLIYPILILIIFTLTACGAGYRTRIVNGHKKVYHVDEQGNKTLVYEVNKDGKTVVHDKSDPRSKQHLAKQKIAKKVKQADAQRVDRIKRARKRKAKDPIYIALYPTQLGSKLKQVEKPKGAVFKQIRKQIKSDRIIKLVSMKKLKRNKLAKAGKRHAGVNPKRAPVADVDVVSRGYLKEVYGINKRTGKPGKMVVVVFEATITSNFIPTQYKVSESDNIFRNVELTERFAKKIKRIIKRKIGPTIPADRSI